MSASKRLSAVPSPEVEAAPLAYFRHLEYPNVRVHLPGLRRPIQFQSFFYTTTDPEEIAALRAKGGAIVEDSGEPEFRCDVCGFITLKRAVYDGHIRTAHQIG